MSIRKLTPIEERISGALLEKMQTTPDAYPLTLNSLRAACNQKTGRFPVTSYSPQEIKDALEAMRSDVLAWRSEGSRATRWKTTLPSRLHLNPKEVAVITLLLLRGPQTTGEINSRSGRMASFDGLSEIRELLQKLAGETPPLVLELSRQPGQKGNRWAQLLGESQNFEAQIAALATTQRRVPEQQDGLREMIEDLESRVHRLEAMLDLVVNKCPLPGVAAQVRGIDPSSGMEGE